MRGYQRVLAVGGVAGTVAGAVALVVGPAAAETNTITNPGFESGLAGWSCPATASAATGHARTGTYALVGAATNSDNARCTQTVTVAPNTAYTLSAYVNGAYVYLGATGTGAGDVSTWTPVGGQQRPGLPGSRRELRAVQAGHALVGYPRRDDLVNQLGQVSRG